MKAFKLIRKYPFQQTIDLLLVGVTFDNGMTVVQFPLPKPNLGIFRSFKDFKKAYKRLFELEQKTELVEVEV
jgi:hypothetical protein